MSQDNSVFTIKDQAAAITSIGLLGTKEDIFFLCFLFFYAAKLSTKTKLPPSSGSLINQEHSVTSVKT